MPTPTAAELTTALRDMVRYAEAAKWTVGMGTLQTERLARAKSLLGQADAMLSHRNGETA